jgi:hypothetical protein
MRASGMTRSVMPDAANRQAKANRDATGRVQVPAEALMTGTPSRTARVSAARRNLKEAAGKLPVRGTRTASEANGSRARGRIDPKPDGIRIEPAYMRRTRGRKVARLTLRDLPSCLRARHAVRRADGSAEVRRGHSKRGPTVRSIETLTREGRNGQGSQDRPARMKGRAV